MAWSGKARRFMAGVAMVAVALGATGAISQNVQFFRIGTGNSSGTYFPIGAVIATAISNPPGSLSCEDGGSCGVPSLVATAVTTRGSTANIEAIASDKMESGLVQADVAYWAQTGTGVFEGKLKVESLRVIANLYPESIHLVVPKNSNITTIADLKGKRVSMDEAGSGTLLDARLILQAFGLTQTDIDIKNLTPAAAAESMRRGDLDAFFFVGGYPATLVSDLANAEPGIRLVPISGPEVDQMLPQHRFFSRASIPAGTYKGAGKTDTLSVGAQWVTSANVDEATVYDITRTLWNKNTRKLLDAGHGQGKLIQIDHALTGLAIPLHAGAEKFYTEIGILR
jgi:TRAP transporter TAXI family solute receptor